MNANENERALPVLPLLLWRTPPGLELILRQEGIAHRRLDRLDASTLRGGRFLVIDSKDRVAWESVGSVGADHVVIDVDTMRRGMPIDPFAALVDPRAARGAWDHEGVRLVERVSLHDKGALRVSLIGRLRAIVTRAGGLWARIAPYPRPYRSAFNFRADLDEPDSEDYFRFAAARRPLDDCTTHFVSTNAYGHDARVLDDLRRLDTQSHGHYHHIYRDPESNRRNLERARRMLREEGIEVVGFAAPGGRWNRGLDSVLEAGEYSYSSDFSLGYDDYPFFPWLGDRWSRVLQLPIHPVCEGLFNEAGRADEEQIARYLASVTAARLSAGEPAFVYGHPERRLGRMPSVLLRIAESVDAHPLAWRVTLTEFARWWKWREGLRWSVRAIAGDRFAIRFEEWSASYPISLEIDGGEHIASLPLRGEQTILPRLGLSFERRRVRLDRATPTAVPGPLGIRPWVKEALDWELETPVDELAGTGFLPAAKRGLRRWRAARCGILR